MGIQVSFCFGGRSGSYSNMSEGEEIRVREFLDKITVVGLDNNIKEFAIAPTQKLQIKASRCYSGGDGKESQCKFVDKRLCLAHFQLAVWSKEFIFSLRAEEFIKGL